ncbi:MAG: AsmA family protein [Kiritimatiellae bacterium]|nr:AsmA family protein [Kiritimatiellia bacterium]
MKKALKIIAGIVIGIVALALLLVLTLPIWLGPVVKPIANASVPKFTKTTFNLGHLSLNPYTGRFELGDLTLGNPEGYSEPQALAVSNIVVDVAMTTVCDKYVHVEEVTIDGVFVSIVKGGENNVDNIDQIQYNIAGGKDKYEANKAKAKAEKKARKDEPEEEPAEDSGEGKKVVIDKLTLKDISVKYGLITIPIPSITLTDLGKESDGMSLEDLGTAIWEAILNAAMAVGDGAKALGGLLMSGAGAVGDGASKAVDVVSDGASKTVDAVSDGAGKAVDAVSDGAGKAVDAISDGAGKAVDAVKSLFK